MHFGPSRTGGRLRPGKRVTVKLRHAADRQLSDGLLARLFAMSYWSIDKKGEKQWLKIRSEHVNNGLRPDWSYLRPRRNSLGGAMSSRENGRSCPGFESTRNTALR